MTPEQREAALRLALLLEQAFGPRWVFVHEAVALLRELAAEPVQEPVGWLHDETGEFEHSHQQWMESDGDWVPVYAAPQQRRPLTDEQLKQAMSDAGVRVFQPGLWDVLLDAGRAIERAHGITGEPT